MVPHFSIYGYEMLRSRVLHVALLITFWFEGASCIGFPFFSKLEPVHCVHDATGLCIQHVHVHPAVNLHNWYAPDLNPYLIPFASQSCFQLIDNYYNLNLPPATTPIVLRHLQSATIITGRSQTQGGWAMPHAFWTPANHKNVNTSGYFVTECHGSTKFYATASNYVEMENICVALAMPQFASSSKPWNCQSHFSLFLNPGHDGPKHRPEMFDTIHGLGAAFPSTRSQVNVLVWGFQDLNSDKRNFWVTMNGMWTKTALSHELFILLHVGLMEYTFESRLQSVGLRIFHFCFSCDGFATFVPLAQSELHNITNLTYIVYPHTDGNIMWVLPYRLYNGMNVQLNLDEMISKHVSNFDTDITYDMFGTPSKHDFMSKVYAHLWASALKNYSMITNLGIMYKNGRVMKYTYRFLPFGMKFEAKTFMENSGTYYPVVANNSVDNLRFVGCSDRGYKPLAFGEYLNVFDYMIWI